MKRLVLFFFLIFISKVHAQQKINWAEILYGNAKDLEINKIKSLKLKKGGRVIRLVQVISKNSILVKDSLTEDLFEFDDENRLISVTSIKAKQNEKFRLNFKGNFINKISRLVNDNRIRVYNQFSKVNFNNRSYEEKETYRFDTNKNDSLNVFRIKYFFNEQNPELSYEETYDNGRIWTKKYFNNTEVRKEKFENYNKVDSTLTKDSKLTKYHFENYKNHQIIRIERDSVLTIEKKYGRKVSEKLEYAGLSFRQIFYDENEIVREKIIYQNYKNSFNEWIVWEERKYDGKGTLISRKFPNKKEYKLKNGILVFRKNVERIRMSCGVGYSDKKKNLSAYYYPQLYSSSILFTPKLAKNFIDNFDIYAIDEDEEIIYSYLDFTDDTKVITSNSTSKDIYQEFRSTSRSIRRKERYILRYFDGTEVEAETISGKKYFINLAKNPEILSFSIHTFLIKNE
ncbi:hypothetical protein QX233_01720 [Chryseobacterium gambrini]|uniref:YD repeat-containing protein n=1 Tax=Chryseobacterium gambrini TaxID=373672 RepID=A0AAJ1R082_9FLAO|nr:MULTISPECIES: hypothetical protein [Chryseobacterium]MDN4011171.1 hypothetical protein [Chryseobacterium gambrini]QWA37526.1 hypothetical protein KKI44_16550 [Chryseobacterium sp. ZHDP1]